MVSRVNKQPHLHPRHMSCFYPALAFHSAHFHSSKDWARDGYAQTERHREIMAQGRSLGGNISRQAEYPTLKQSTALTSRPHSTRPTDSSPRSPKRQIGMGTFHSTFHPPSFTKQGNISIALRQHLPRPLEKLRLWGLSICTPQMGSVGLGGGKKGDRRGGKILAAVAPRGAKSIQLLDTSAAAVPFMFPAQYFDCKRVQAQSPRGNLAKPYKKLGGQIQGQTQNNFKPMEQARAEGVEGPLSSFLEGPNGLKQC